MDSLKASVTTLTEKIEGLAKIARPGLLTYIPALVYLTTVFGLAMSPLYWLSTSNYAELSKVKSSRYSAEDARRDFGQFDSVLQREMRLLDDSIKKDITALYERISVVEDRLYDHQKDGHPNAHREDTERRLRALEGKHFAD